MPMRLTLAVYKNVTPFQAKTRYGWPLSGNQLPLLRVDEEKYTPFLLEKRETHYICHGDTALTFLSLLEIVLIYQSYRAFKTCNL